MNLNLQIVTAACNIPVSSIEQGAYWKIPRHREINSRTDSPTKFRLNVERSLIVYAGIPLYCFKCSQLADYLRIYILYLNIIYIYIPALI